MEYLERSSGRRCENLAWRSGLCNWCRGCMPMSGAMSLLVKGTVKSLKWSSVFIKTRFSAYCSSSLCLKPCHANSALGSPGRTSLPVTLVSSLNRLRNVSRGSWLGKRQWRRKDWANAGKTKIMICVTGLTLCRVQASFHAQSVPLVWAVTASSETVASTDCTRNADESNAWQRTLITDILSARELHAAWTVDHRGKYKSNLSSCRW